METNNSNKTKRSRTKVVMGLALIAFGALMFGSNLGLAVPSWLTSWPVLLILIGVIAGIKHRFKRPGAYVLFLIGTIFLTDKLMPGFQFHELIFPLVITSAGIFLILKRNERNFKDCHHWRGYKHFNEPQE